MSNVNLFDLKAVIYHWFVEMFSFYKRFEMAGSNVYYRDRGTGRSGSVHCCDNSRGLLYEVSSG